MVVVAHCCTRQSRAPNIKVVGQTVQPWEHKQTGRQTDGRYLGHYLPHFAVDNKHTNTHTDATKCIISLDKDSGCRPGPVAANDPASVQKKRLCEEQTAY